VGEKAGTEGSITPSPPHPIAPSVFSPCCQTSARRYIKKHRDVATCDTCGMLLLGYGNDRDYDETRKALAEQGTPSATMTQGALKVIAKPRLSKSTRGA
jgi:ribosomal protein L34E